MDLIVQDDRGVRGGPRQQNLMTSLKFSRHAVVIFAL
jgi:hypothetical protein